MRALDRALEALRHGDPRHGEVLIMDPLVRALAREGPGTRAHARASADVATYLVALGDLERAETALATSVAVPATSPDERRELASWIASYAELLVHRGRWEDAATSLRRAVAVHREAWGPDHERTAGAALSLAETLLRRGPDAEAADHAERALLALWGHGDDRALRALVVEGLANGAHGAFALYFDAAPAELRDRAPDLVLGFAETHPPLLVLPVLSRLHQDRVARHGADDATAIDLLVAATNLARRAGDPALRIATARVLVAALRRAGRTGEAVRALLSLAGACADAGDAPAAEIAFDAAEREAAADDAALASVAIARGTWHLEAGRLDEAARVLGEAARGPLAGRAALLLGLGLAHADRAAEALPVLQRAQRLLDPTGPDHAVAASHVEALTSGGPCACGTLGSVLSDEVRSRVRAAVPGLDVEQVAVRLEHGVPQVDLRLARPPTEAERQSLDRALKTAMDAIRRRYRAP